MERVGALVAGMGFEQTSGRLRAMRAPEFLAAEASDVEWLVDGLIQAASVTLLVGDPKTFKTMLCTQLAVSVAADLGSFLGREARGGPVVLVELEGARASLGRRLNAQLIALGQPAPECLLVVTGSLRLDLEDGMTELVGHIADLRPSLIVLDPLMFLHEGDENSATDMGRLMGRLVRLAADVGAAVLVVHHTAKPVDTRRGTRERIHPRGSGVLEAAASMTLSAVRANQTVISLHALGRDAAPDILRLAFNPETMLLEPTNFEVPSSKVSSSGLIDLAARKGSITVRDVVVEFEVAKNTGATALRAHETDGILERIADSRPTAYRLAKVSGQ